MFISSSTPGGILDRAIEAEDKRHGDFLRLVLPFLYYMGFVLIVHATSSKENLGL